MTGFSVVIVTLVILSAQPTFSISLRFPNRNFPSEATHSLLGDAHFVDGGYSVQLSGPTPSSFGIILRTTPFKFTSSTSFSSNFTFQIGNGVALVIIPADFPSKFAQNTSFGLLDVDRFLDIEFDVDLCKISSSRVSNVSKINHILKGGVKLSSWIDYHAILKQVDVRLSKLGDPRPVESLISYRIDLGEMWKGEEALLGLASPNGNHGQTTNVYSWRSKIKNVPKWLHSNPANPQDHSSVPEDVETSKKRDCFLSGFIFVMSCGALAALVLFFVWSYVAAMPKVPSVSPVDFKYEKIGVVEMKDSETIKK
ncbi:L-type lectin-domain containing receptor kinase S.4-like [Cynara cardunculus var. scolymus]|uniref:L-type lectin-domain containing receptor kinase S.4-like n=1 Tax=Cynara cardunculus var. scolymus TaxID=59895 RepID=UPI000D630360|nr:L-type lectin-domain containing receptor kinase S.4-like [Cynara cardunculus var. scolymus]